MKPTPQTWALLVAALVLLAMNLLDLAPGGDADALPRLAAVSPEQVSRIELSNSVDKIVLVPDEAAPQDAGTAEGVSASSTAEGRRWRLLAPVEGRADQQMVQALLSAFQEDAAVDVRVDQGNLDSYGLEPGQGVVVELWAGAQAPALSFTVGLDSPGGSSFVRLSGDDAIYRARVGGRERYPVEVSRWRNRVPLGVAPEQVTRLTLERPETAPVVLVREGAASLQGPGAWELDPPAPWAVDQAGVEALLGRLGALRAEEVLAGDFDGGFEPPLVRATLGLADGSERRLRLGSRAHPQAAFLQVEGDDVVYRVPRREVMALLVDRDGTRDRTMLALAPADVDALLLEEGGRRWMLRQVGGEGRWTVVDPPGAELDIERVLAAARILVSLRGDAVADGVQAEAAGLEAPGAVITIATIDGGTHALELGAATTGRDGQPARYARVRGRGPIMVLAESTVQRLLTAFRKA